MKKNITINLCGRLFNIDEDAYELLHNYMETLRNYFQREEGGDEIADDIEERIAELLDELKASGVEAVNIDHVKDIINRVGQPEQMEGDTETADCNAQQQSAYHQPYGHKGVEGIKEFFKNRRLYRNPKDKMLAGVISGLASSFEIEATQLRLVVILGLLVLSFLGSFLSRDYTFIMFNMNVVLAFVGCYIILALVMPEAETPEQQLKMQGKPVTMANLGNEVVQGVDERTERPKRGGVVRRLFNGVAHFFATCFKVLLVMLAISLFCAGVILIVWSLLAIYMPDQAPYFFDWYTAKILEGNMPLFLGFLLAALLALFIPAYGIVHSLVSRMSVLHRILAIVLWVVAMVTAVCLGIMLTQISDKYWHQSRNAVVTINGVEVSLDEYDFLNENGWYILNAEGCNGRLLGYGEYYMYSTYGRRYLDSYDDHHRQRYRVERSDTLMPGTYELTVAARANGTGAFVYALVDGKKQLIEIPASGNEGGGIWQAARDSIDHMVATMPDQIPKGPQGTPDFPDEWEEAVKANDGKGYGWNRLTFDPIVITKPNTVVSYGLTSDPAFTGQTWLGQWFSACDFELKKQ